MQKGLIRKGLIISIIVLFIGVGIQPVFAGESITSTLDKEEDCIECQVTDGISLLRVKFLLFRVKVVTNIILSSKLGEIPEIKENCEEILDVINSDKPLDERLICDVLWSMLLSFEPIFQLIEILVHPTLPDFINNLLISILSIFSSIVGGIYIVGVGLDCWEMPTP